MIFTSAPLPALWALTFADGALVHVFGHFLSHTLCEALEVPIEAEGIWHSLTFPPMHLLIVAWQVRVNFDECILDTDLSLSDHTIGGLLPHFSCWPTSSAIA